LVGCGQGVAACSRIVAQAGQHPGVRRVGLVAVVGKLVLVERVRLEPDLSRFEDQARVLVVRPAGAQVAGVQAGVGGEGGVRALEGQRAGDGLQRQIDQAVVEIARARVDGVAGAGGCVTGAHGAFAGIARTVFGRILRQAGAIEQRRDWVEAPGPATGKIIDAGGINLADHVHRSEKVSIQIWTGGDVCPRRIPCKVDKTFAFHPRAAINQGLCRRRNVKCRSIFYRCMNGDMAAEVSPPINRATQ